MRKLHTWGKDGFCVHCHNVHQTDGNARSTCSDGFTCAGETVRCPNHWGGGGATRCPRGGAALQIWQRQQWERS